MNGVGSDSRGRHYNQTVTSADQRAAGRAERIKSWALEAGFDRAGVASAEPSEFAAEYQDWLDRGDHAGMQYLERNVERRADSRKTLPAVRSVLCVALDYGDQHAALTGTGDLWARVARYAHGDDYHLVMEKRLHALAERIEAAWPGTELKVYVDTGPVLERELAARAGLGAIGKNTMLLHPEAGSWFLLGEILLSLDLEPDHPLADLCGTCTECLDACPTGALPGPYRLDANRCISYWTIEHRGEFPPDAPDTHGWIFGCDICQEVCPVNAAPEINPDPAFELPAHRAQLNLIDLLSMDREEYVERFRRSPMKRAKLEGLKRNVEQVVVRSS